MSSKSFFVLNTVDGVPGVMYERDTHDAAIDQAVAIAKEQCGVNEVEIRAELERDSNFVPQDRIFRVDILQVEDD